jgi:DNA-binding FadR family transcriptional regulator
MPVMTQTTRHLTYRGNPAFASMLVQMLEEAGATVEWKPPVERRGIGASAHDVIVGIVAAGTYDAIKAAIDRFRKHMDGKAVAVVEVDEQDDPPKGRHAQ